MIRMIVSAFLLVAIVAVLVFDGLSMYGAHREAMKFATQAGDQAAQTFVDSKGDEDVVHKVVQDLASNEGVELVDLSFNKGTTRWYKVTVRVESSSILLKYIPYFKDRLPQKSTAIEHF